MCRARRTFGIKIRQLGSATATGLLGSQSVNEKTKWKRIVRNHTAPAAAHKTMEINNTVYATRAVRIGLGSDLSIYAIYNLMNKFTIFIHARYARCTLRVNNIIRSRTVRVDINCCATNPRVVGIRPGDTYVRRRVTLASDKCLCKTRCNAVHIINDH